MPIDVVYGVDPTLQALAAARGSGAAVASEQEWRERALAEQQYQFDENSDWRLQQAALQDRLSRYEMGNRTALGFAQLNQTNQNNQLDYMLGQQQLAQRDEQLGVQAAVAADQQQQLTNRTQMSQLGQIARQQQEQKFQNAMAARKSVEDWMRTVGPRQRQQAVAGWEKEFQMPWGAPDEAMAVQEEQEMQAKRQQWLGMLQAPDGSGELIVPENVADMLMNMDPEKAMGSYTKMLDTWTRRKKDEQSAQTTEMQWEETKANMLRDDERANQTLEHTQVSHEQKLKQAEEQAKQKMVMDAYKNYQSARVKWATAKTAAKNDEGKKSFGEEPKLEDFLPQEATGEAELEPGLGEGKVITNPAGKRAILHEDGTVTPLN
jgi:hypothetical protein